VQVAFDEQIFLLQRRGGISRYFTELIRAFDGDRSLHVDAATPFRDIANDHLGMVTSRSFRGHEHRLSRRALMAVARARPRRRAHPDVVHHTFFHPRFLRDYPGVAKAVTVFDMIPERQSGAVPPEVHLAKDEYVARADLILTLSEASRADIADHYPRLQAPIVVVALGVDPIFAAGGAAPVPGPYLLFVGQRGGYKDFATLTRAFARVAPDHPDLRLLAVGGGRFTADEHRDAAALGLGGRVTQVTLTDAKLPGAYAGARAFVMPSRYEGFGLPALEAMAAGAPTLLADASSLPEVGGDAALYFPSGDAAALADELQAVLSNDPAVANLVAAGRERALGFTWQATAAATATAYRRVA
jgi:glycosyltransferase involved in cell wall biosynthesis